MTKCGDIREVPPMTEVPETQHFLLKLLLFFFFFFPNTGNAAALYSCSQSFQDNSLVSGAFILIYS